MVSNRHEKAKQKADYKEDEPHWSEDNCPGCRWCECVKCGGHIVAIPAVPDSDKFACMWCGHNPDEEDL